MSYVKQLLFNVAFYNRMGCYVTVYVGFIHFTYVYHLSGPIQLQQLDVTFVLPSCGGVYLL